MVLLESTYPTIPTQQAVPVSVRRQTVRRVTKWLTHWKVWNDQSMQSSGPANRTPEPTTIATAMLKVILTHETQFGPKPI